MSSIATPGRIHNSASRTCTGSMCHRPATHHTKIARPVAIPRTSISFNIETKSITIKNNSTDKKPSVSAALFVRRCIIHRVDNAIVNPKTCTIRFCNFPGTCRMCDHVCHASNNVYESKTTRTSTLWVHAKHNTNSTMVEIRLTSAEAGCATMFLVVASHVSNGNLYMTLILDQPIFVCIIRTYFPFR